MVGPYAVMGVAEVYVRLANVWGKSREQRRLEFAPRGPFCGRGVYLANTLVGK